jgi:hypothetical protein
MLSFTLPLQSDPAKRLRSIVIIVRIGQRRPIAAASARSLDRMEAAFKKTFAQRLAAQIKQPSAQIAVPAKRLSQSI